MGKKSSSPPPAPDPTVTAQAQAAANRDAILASAYVNRINETTPWGNLTYTRVPGSPAGAGGKTAQPLPVSMSPTTPGGMTMAQVQQKYMLPAEAWERNGLTQEGYERDLAAAQGTPALGAAPAAAPAATASTDPTAGLDQWSRHIELSPSGQRQLDAQNALAEALLGKAMTRTGQITDAPLDFSGMPALSALPDGDFSADRQKVEDALYGRATSRLDPQYEKAQRDLETRLANQGINVGTEAWSRAMDDLNRGRTDAYGAARSDAIAAGGAEQSRMFGQEAQLFGLSMQQRQQLINELMTQRSQPWNEIAAILQGSPAMATPSFSPTAQYQVAPPDVMGAYNTQYQGALNAYNQNQANSRATTGALAGMAGTIGAAMISSKEFKEDKAPLDADETLEAVRSMPIEAWTYKKGIGDGGRHIGPYAEDFAERFGGDGKTINVIDAVGASLASVKALADRLERFEMKRAA